VSLPDIYLCVTLYRRHKLQVMRKNTAKRSISQAAKPKLSKAAFVRSLPAITPAKEVVAKAKAQGISLTNAYVYNVRATWKAATTSAKRTPSRERHPDPAPARGMRRKRGPATIHLDGVRSVEDLLRSVAAELGLVRAIQVLQGEHVRVRKLLGR